MKKETGTRGHGITRCGIMACTSTASDGHPIYRAIGSTAHRTSVIQPSSIIQACCIYCFLASLTGFQDEGRSLHDGRQRLHLWLHCYSLGGHDRPRRYPSSAFQQTSEQPLCLHTPNHKLALSHNRLSRSTRTARRAFLFCHDDARSMSWPEHIEDLCDPQPTSRRGTDLQDKYAIQSRFSGIG